MQAWVTEQAARKALAEIEAWHVRRDKDFWPDWEALGRCLRYLGDPAWAEALQSARARYPYTPGRDADELFIANFHRLLGNDAAAQAAYARADALLAGFLPSSPPTLGKRVICAFLLGDDAAVVAYARQLQGRARQPNPKLTATHLGTLAAARLVGDVTAVTAAADACADWVRRGRFRPWDTGFFTPWDAYDVMQVAAQILEQGNR